MHAIAYARFNEEAGRLFKEYTMFNQACAYPVIARSETEVIIETHPCPRASSSKLVIPVSLITTISENPLTLVPPGMYRFAQPMIDFNGYSASEWPRGIEVRDKDCRVEVKAQARDRGTSGAIRAVEVNFGTTILSWGVPVQWLLPADVVATAAPAAGPAPAKEPEKPKYNHPDKSSAGKFVRYINPPNEKSGGVWWVLEYDTYHNRCRLYNQASDHYCKPDLLELVDWSWVKVGALCTQSDRWLARGHCIRGETGHTTDTVPHLFVIRDDMGNGSRDIGVVNAAGNVMKLFNTFADDIRPLTDKESEAWKTLRSTSRDEKWLRAAAPKPVMVMIDKHPASPFTLGIIMATMGVALLPGVNTTEAIIAGLLAQAASIKLPDHQWVTMEMLGNAAPKPVEIVAEEEDEELAEIGEPL